MAKVFGLILNEAAGEAFTLAIGTTLFHGVIGSHSNTFHLKKRRLFHPEVRQSAEGSAEYLNTLLRNDQRLHRSTELRFEIKYDNINAIEGRSMDLAFAMAFAVEFMQDTYPQQTIKIPLAATGTLAPDGKIGKIGGINEKLKAALDKDIQLILYPVANDDEIEPGIREKAGKKLICVGNIASALSKIGFYLRNTYAGEPYRDCLKTFDVCHAPIFFGREHDISKIFTKWFEHITSEQPNLNLLIMGASGSGKSSLVYAGLLANLERSIANLTVKDFPHPLTDCLWTNWYPRVITQDQAVHNNDEPESEQRLIKEVHSLIQSILTSWSKFRGVNKQLLEEETKKETPQTIDQLIQLLMTALPNYEPSGTTQLIVVLDQLEEVFTHQYSTSALEWLKDFISALNAKNCWVIGTLRNDFFSDYQASCLECHTLTTLQYDHHAQTQSHYGQFY